MNLIRGMLLSKYKTGKITVHLLWLLLKVRTFAFLEIIIRSYLKITMERFWISTSILFYIYILCNNIISDLLIFLTF